MYLSLTDKREGRKKEREEAEDYAEETMKVRRSNAYLQKICLSHKHFAGKKKMLRYKQIDDIHVEWCMPIGLVG